MAKLRVTNTTDWKYIWLIFDDKEELKSPDGIVFHPTDIKELEKGYVQYSNSNYILLAKYI